MDLVRRPVTPTRIVAVRGDRRSERPDSLATEEPMEIRAHGPGQDPMPVSVTLRTPGHDFDLAVGFLHGEGLLYPGDVSTICYCERVEREEQAYNIVTVLLRRPFVPPPPRAFTVTGACGVCGKSSLDDVAARCDPVGPGPRVPAALLAELPDRLRAAQSLFDRTGGLHGAGLFDAGGEVLCVREDIGRHNAVDKAIGHALLKGDLPLSRHVLVVSGRASLEIVQKALAAAIPVIASVSAPSSLAVNFAREANQTLIGFLRPPTFNVYAHVERLAVAD